MLCPLPSEESRRAQPAQERSLWLPSQAAERPRAGPRWPDTRRCRTSSALPSRMKPGSEYSARAPGSASRGNSRQARNSAAGVALCGRTRRSPAVPNCVPADGAASHGARCRRGAAHHKSGQQIAQRRIQVEQAALVKQHCHCGGCHNLGQAGHVEDGLGSNGRRSFFVGEVPRAS